MPANRTRQAQIPDQATANDDIAGGFAHFALPVTPPFSPMEARSAGSVPKGPGYQFEPKWDGFRCLAFRDGKHVALQSKAGKPLDRYFPEIVQALLDLKAARFVLDGELVIPVGDHLSFDDLLMRIHPASSRVKKLAQETPAVLVLFDILVNDRNVSLTGAPLEKRRIELEQFFAKYGATRGRLRLSPRTRSVTEARQWSETRAGLDGIIAKLLDRPYESGERTGAVLKIKKLRTAECVVGGFRYASRGREIGSLLLGLYDQDKLLNHVGFTSSLHQGERRMLTGRLEKLIKPPGFTGATPGGPSRWSTERSAQWEPLAPKLVVEVQYDHFSGGRFRHGTKFLRWRPDKAPEQCSMRQVESESHTPLPKFD